MNTDKWIDKTLGKYKLEKLLGEGTSGAVYQAKNIKLNKVVAIKILLPSITGGEQGERATKRFFREAQTTAQLNHPNIVQIYDIEEEDGIYYLVMELIQGRNLQYILKEEGPFHYVRALQIVQEVAHGLQEAHRQNIIHQDIKPGNILLTNEGVSKITDFGLARRLTGDVAQLSMTGTIVGTPLYISPEQILGSRKPSPASDIYSLGATLFHLIDRKSVV